MDAHQCLHFCILDQLTFLGGLQGQPHEEQLHCVELYLHMYWNNWRGLEKCRTDLLIFELHHSDVILSGISTSPLNHIYYFCIKTKNKETPRSYIDFLTQSSKARIIFNIIYLAKGNEIRLATFGIECQHYV